MEAEGHWGHKAINGANNNENRDERSQQRGGRGHKPLKECTMMRGDGLAKKIMKKNRKINGDERLME